MLMFYKVNHNNLIFVISEGKSTGFLAFPMYHIGAFWFSTSAFYNGRKIIIFNNLSPAEVLLEKITKYKVIIIK